MTQAENLDLITTRSKGAALGRIVQHIGAIIIEAASIFDYDIPTPLDEEPPSEEKEEDRRFLS